MRLERGGEQRIRERLRLPCLSLDENRLNSGDWRLEQRRRADTRERGKIFRVLSGFICD